MKTDNELNAHLQMMKDISAQNARDVNKDLQIVNDNLKKTYYK